MVALKLALLLPLRIGLSAYATRGMLICHPCVVHLRPVASAAAHNSHAHDQVALVLQQEEHMVFAIECREKLNKVG